MGLIDQVAEKIECHRLFSGDGTCVVGVSGGPDSLCLLRVLKDVAPELGIRLHVGHLNHATRGESADEDAAYVADLCAAWGLPCTIERVDVPARAEADGLSLEEAARQERYAFLWRLASRLGAQWVAVGHNADDQVETVLMHLLRGAGVRGLRGMRPVSSLARLRLGRAIADCHDDLDATVRLVRPLLEVGRDQIEAYCQTHDLIPRQDRSNLDTTYFRNRLRHELIPLLETYNPGIRGNLWRMAEVMAGEYQVLRQELLRAWGSVVLRRDRQGLICDLNAFLQLPIGLQRSLLREGIHQLRRSLRDIEWGHIEGAIELLREGDVGAQSVLPNNLRLEKGYSRFYLREREAHWCQSPDSRSRWPLIRRQHQLEVPGETTIAQGRWRCICDVTPRERLNENWRDNPDRWIAYLDADRVGATPLLRPRQEGDLFAPLGAGFRQKLSDFMINVKIPEDVRAHVPLLVVSRGQIAWVVGWRIDDRFAIDEETQHVLVVRIRPRLPKE